MAVANSESVAAKTKLNLWLAGGLALLALFGIALWLAFRPAEIITLRVAAGQKGSDSFTLMTEIAEVTARSGKPVRLDVLATGDATDNIVQLNKRDVDLAVIRADTPVVSDVRLVADLYDDYFQLITRPGSGINTLEQLSGKRIALPPPGTDGYRSFFVIVDHYDLDIGTMRWVAMSLDQARRKLINGDLDAVFTVRSLRDPVLLRVVGDAEIAKLRLDVLPLGQADAIVLKRPLLRAGTIGIGSLSGALPLPSRDIKTIAATRVLVAHENGDANAIRALTEILFENRLDLTVRMPLAAAITKPDESAGLAVPLHQGASDYFNRDAPSFLEANSNSLGLLLTIAAMIGSGLLALRARLLAGQKNKADMFNYRLMELNTRANESESLAEFADIRAELASMMATVIIALDKDEVTDEGFHSFSRIHESVSASVRDAEQRLRRSSV
ncbi:MAG: TAXI family TRAP transporter solute-binding subunit [Notoacmeibacter sp.]